MLFVISFRLSFLAQNFSSSAIFPQQWLRATYFALIVVPVSSRRSTGSESTPTSITLVGISGKESIEF